MQSSARKTCCRREARGLRAPVSPHALLACPPTHLAPTHKGFAPKFCLQRLHPHMGGTARLVLMGEDCRSEQTWSRFPGSAVWNGARAGVSRDVNLAPSARLDAWPRATIQKENCSGCPGLKPERGGPRVTARIGAICCYVTAGPRAPGAAAG